MSAKSEAHRRYLYARFGEAWVKAHHFDNPGKLPKHAPVTRALAHRRKGAKR